MPGNFHVGISLSCVFGVLSSESCDPSGSNRCQNERVVAHGPSPSIGPEAETPVYLSEGKSLLFRPSPNRHKPLKNPILAPAQGTWVIGLELGCGENGSFSAPRTIDRSIDRSGYVPRIRTKNRFFSAARGQSPGDGTRPQAPRAIKVGFNVRATRT